MTTKRNPITDPKPGDAWEDPFGCTMVVTSVAPEKVTVVMDGQTRWPIDLTRERWLDCTGVGHVTDLAENQPEANPTHDP